MAMRGQYLIPGRLGPTSRGSVALFWCLCLCPNFECECQFGVVVQSEVASLRHVLENVQGSDSAGQREPQNRVVECSHARSAISDPVFMIEVEKTRLDGGGTRF